MNNAIEVFEKTFWKEMCSSIRANQKDYFDRTAAMNVDFQKEAFFYTID